MMNPAIYKAIQIAGGTQALLAESSGVSQASISILLNGRNGRVVVPRLATAKLLSKATGIPWFSFMDTSSEYKIKKLKKLMIPIV